MQFLLTFPNSTGSFTESYKIGRSHGTIVVQQEFDTSHHLVLHGYLKKHELGAVLRFTLIVLSLKHTHGWVVIF